MSVYKTLHFCCGFKRSELFYKTWTAVKLKHCIFVLFHLTVLNRIYTSFNYNYMAHDTKSPATPFNCVIRLDQINQTQSIHFPYQERQSWIRATWVALPSSTLYPSWLTLHEACSTRERHAVYLLHSDNDLNGMYIHLNQTF